MKQICKRSGRSVTFVFFFVGVTDLLSSSFTLWGLAYHVNKLQAATLAVCAVGMCFTVDWCWNDWRQLTQRLRACVAGLLNQRPMV